MSEASGHVLELSGKLQVMETSLAESRSRELQLLRDLEEVKRCYRESERDISLLRGNCFIQLVEEAFFSGSTHYQKTEKLISIYYKGK